MKYCIDSESTMCRMYTGLFRAAIQNGFDRVGNSLTEETVEI